MNVSKQTIEKLNRKVSRELEISSGSRVSYNRVYKNKKTYDRKRDRRIGWQD
jgi:hypothetical protein